MFVGIAYISIKVIDHYEILFNGINGMLTTIWPFLLAFVLAYVFNPIIVFLEKKFKCKRKVFIFLTLTQKNMSADELKDELDKVLYGFKKLMLKSEIKKAIKGWFRGLEITHNTDKKSQSYATYHPHIHMILAVRKGYFTGKEYIKHERFREMWQECMELDYLPQVNVKRFKASNQKEMEKSLAKTSKYTVEKDDFLIEDDYEMTDKTVETLDKALAYRRLVAWGGELKKIHKELNLDDAETGDLVKTDLENEDLRGLEFYIECVGWHF